MSGAATMKCIERNNEWYSHKGHEERKLVMQSYRRTQRGTISCVATNNDIEGQ